MDFKLICEEMLKLQCPKLIITGEINHEKYTLVGQAICFLHTRGSPDVDVVIDSSGGDVAAGLDIYDLLRLYPGKKIGTVFNKAASMAAIVLQACTKRCCARHSEILIHHISRRSVQLDVLRRPKKLAMLIEDMEKQQDRLYGILCLRTTRTLHSIKRECAKDRPMDAEEALKFGLIDEIV